MGTLIEENLHVVLQITGDSIYNLLAVGEVETGKDDRPLDPIPKIKSVEVAFFFSSNFFI